MKTTKLYKNYEACYAYNEEDKIFRGHVAGITRLIAIEGNTEKNLEKKFRTNIDDYLKMCAKKGIKPEKPDKSSEKSIETKRGHFMMFIEYLRRNETYQKYCEFMRDTGNKFDWHLNPHGNEKTNYLWVAFGDIFLIENEKLWNNYIKFDSPVIEKFDLLEEIKNTISYMRKQYNRALERDPTIDELSRWFDMELTGKPWIFFKVDKSNSPTLTRLRKEFNLEIKEEFNERRKGSNHEIGVDELRKYLKVFDLYDQGLRGKSVSDNMPLSERVYTTQGRSKYLNKARKYVDLTLTCSAPFNFPNLKK